MNKSCLLGAVCIVLFSFVTTSANAALIGRVPITTGGTDYQAAYDDVLGITWLADANLAASNTFGVAGINALGYMNWDTADSWITAMNAANHLSYDDWRLASMSVTAGMPDSGYQTSIDSCTTGVACPTNELGHMYYYNLGGNGNDLTGNQTVGDVTLTDVEVVYWSGTEYDSSNAWITYFVHGTQLGGGGTFDSNFMHVWAVRTGDVGAVPIPASVWLFGSGLLGLIGIARRKKAT